MTEDQKNNKSETAKREEEVLQFWQDNDIFKKTLEKVSPKGEFVFYDGPPFATGLPHYGSLLGSIIKDVIPRYKTMRGYFVRRRWGWDCHGLPIENMIEKELGLKDKTEIEKIGIKVFNETCRAAVLRYAHDWKKFIDRVGRWVEYDNAYMTMDATYTESVWWALKSAYEKGLMYEGRKVLLYCPHCQTPIAKAEVQMDNSYKDVSEEAVTVEFVLKSGQRVGDESTDKKTSILAWTTTPWTLPGNVALAVGPEISYVLLEKPDEGSGPLVRFILAKDRLADVFGEDDYKIVAELKGSDLVGLSYEPLYEIEKVKNSGKKAWYVAPADFVTTLDGTGVVHTAVIYGEDDYQLGQKMDLPMVPLLDERGHFTDDAPEFLRGEYFKKAEKNIKEDLDSRGGLFDKKVYTHSYPHCHRCGTALIYNAISSWFLGIQKVKEEMVERNEDINWVPAHLKHGRFLNIVEGAPDWTISRNRYWAAPLPIWKSESGEIEILGSLSELKERTTSHNTFLVVRHGEAEHNVKNIVNADTSKEFHLTEVGRSQVQDLAYKLRDRKIHKIYSSPFPRSKETASILKEGLGIDVEIVIDERLRELNFGDFEGRDFHEFLKYRDENLLSSQDKFPGGESYMDAKKRFGEFVYDINSRLQGETVLVVSHGIALEVLKAVVEGAAEKRFQEILQEGRPATASVFEFEFAPIPHNDNFELDYHRPYIDEISWRNDKGELMRRISEVVDGWVESASMPFAEYHYPFENKEDFEKRFPGDFIAEYIAQTRTWFYYMHAVSTMLFGKQSFKNVVTTGTILAEDGSKMSKSKGNYTDPMENMDKFGSDALRYYLMSSVVMQAEDLRFSDTDVKEAHNRLLNMLWNTYKFYDMYAEKRADGDLSDPKNILDKWILARLKKLSAEVTLGFEEFNMAQASRPLREFVEDLSTWYIRRSRDRFKSESGGEENIAPAITRFVLLELSKLSAPIIPFMADAIYRGLKGEKESVHLENWPEMKELSGAEEEMLSLMKEVRKTASLGLEARSRNNIKVRQPLNSLTIKNANLKGKEEYLDILKDEVNVKDIFFDAGISEEVELDLTITDELKEEGEIRELVRELQAARKDQGLDPKEKRRLMLGTSFDRASLVERGWEEIRKVVNLSDVVKDAFPGDGFKIEV